MFVRSGLLWRGAFSLSLAALAAAAWSADGQGLFGPRTPAHATASTVPPAAAPFGAQDQPLRIALQPDPAPQPLKAQLLGELDRPVAPVIALGETRILTRINSRGELELDARGENRFAPCASEATAQTSLSRGLGKPPLTLNLLVKKKPDGAWTFRNVTVLAMKIEGADLLVADADSNGVYNEPGVDGLTWKGSAYLFPLPAPEERWCTPTHEVTGLRFGPLGEDPAASGRPMVCKVPAALEVLKGVNEERVKLGLTPRPEDAKLSEELQKHCVFMSLNKSLQHPEEKDKTGYSPEGHKAGMRSILSSGTTPQRVAQMMVNTFFHRLDVIRPNALAIGVGYEAAYGGIDGRTKLGKGAAGLWPVLCPAPDQEDVGLRYQKERPDAVPDDASTGYPITAYFATAKLKLSSYTLRAVAAGAPPPVKFPAVAPPPAPPPNNQNLECYTFDPSQNGPNAIHLRFQKVVCLIPKEPLPANTWYEVNLNLEVDGKPWSRTWRFRTLNPVPPAIRPPIRPRR
jgi:hypothetical protein